MPDQDDNEPIFFGAWVPSPEEALLIKANLAERERSGVVSELESERAANWIDGKRAWATKMLGYEDPGHKTEDRDMREFTSWFQ